MNVKHEYYLPFDATESSEFTPSDNIDFDELLTMTICVSSMVALVQIEKGQINVIRMAAKPLELRVNIEIRGQRRASRTTILSELTSTDSLKS